MTMTVKMKMRMKMKMAVMMGCFVPADTGGQ
jgi:hypothetical protein